MVMLNKYKIVDNTLIVYNRKDSREILFDAEDFDFVNQYTWCICNDKNKDYEWVGTNVKQASGKYISKSAHRLLMNEPIDKLIDHYNGNTLDNRKSNLRIANSNINNQNRLDAKGYYKVKNKWKAQIAVDKKKIYLGRYNTEAEARTAYLKAKAIYHPTAPLHLYE